MKLKICALILFLDIAIAVTINEKSDVQSHDKLAINLYTFVDKKGFESFSNETVVNAITADVHNVVRSLFASVEFNVNSPVSSTVIDIHEQTTIGKYLQEFQDLVSDQYRSRQETLILFTGNRWPRVFMTEDTANTMCVRPAIAIIPLLNSSSVRAAQDLAYDIARVVGTNMGLALKTFENCVCSGNLCLMENERISDGLHRDWSSCARSRLAELRAKSPAECDASVSIVRTTDGIQAGAQKVDSAVVSEIVSEPPQQSTQCKACDTVPPVWVLIVGLTLLTLLLLFLCFATHLLRTVAQESKRYHSNLPST